jgi:hypothetical protein
MGHGFRDHGEMMKALTEKSFVTWSGSNTHTSSSKPKHIDNGEHSRCKDQIYNNGSSIYTT